MFLVVWILTCGASYVTTAADPTPSGVLWPGWLGPERNGSVKNFQPPAAWPQELQKVWQVEVGAGYSSPLVADGLVYQHARQGDDEVVWCFDLRTGELKWRQTYPVPFRATPGGERHGDGPKSSPALADGRLFTMSILGDLTAWNAESGERLWRTDYGSRFQPNRPHWGVATSPIVDGDRVIAHFGNDDTGVLVALDVETGAEVWRQGNDGPSYSSPLVVEIQGVRQVVEWNHRALVGVDVKTGRLLWEFPFPHVGSDQNMPTPVVHRGRVLLGGENRGIHCLEPQLEDGTWSVQRHWHQKDVALNMSTAVVNGQWLFGFSHYKSGQLFCLDIESGDVLWQGPGRTGDNVMFLSISGYIVALINDGRLQIIAARGDRFEPVASYRVAEGDTYAPPVLLPDGLLVKDLTTLTFWSLTRPPHRPNILIIFTDDQGYADLGCYGNEKNKTPRLDQLAEEGTRFTSFYVQTVCGPSRSALLTGRYPIRSKGWGMPASEITFAELMRESGYQTACIGKWDVSNRKPIIDRMPNAQGFDYYFGTLGANDGGSVAFHENNEPAGLTRDMGSLTTLYTNKAISYLKERRDPEKPFVLYLAHTMMHTIIDASERFRGKSAGGLYGDVVEEFDYETGRLLDALDELGLRENTLVIYTSDNGPWNQPKYTDKKKGHPEGSIFWGDAGPLRNGKGSCYEGGYRLPCLVRWPSNVPAGRVSDAVFATIDFLPTFAALCGFQVPQDRRMDGIDQSELLLGRRETGREDFYFHSAGVRQGKWKYLKPDAHFHGYAIEDDREKVDELYDLEADVGERTNLAAKFPEKVSELKDLMQSIEGPDALAPEDNRR